MPNAFVVLSTVVLCCCSLAGNICLASSTPARAPSAINCSDAIARAGPGAGPKVNGLLLAAGTNDIVSACLLLKAGKDVNEREAR